ncbi:MAG: hypothetical protein RL531_499 [Actinomycetota bacterium]
MATTSFITSCAEVRPAGRKGRGVFANQRIAAGTTVAAFGGSMVHRDQFEAEPEYRRTHSLQIDTDLFLLCPEQEEPADLFNHSCEANCGIGGNILVVAMRDIEAGEELTFDYAMSDDDDYDEFVCACGEPTCRGLITGADWRRPELQVKYHGWFSTYIARRIAADAESRG